MNVGNIHPSEMASTFELYNYMIDRHKQYAGVPPMLFYENSK